MSAGLRHYINMLKRHKVEMAFYNERFYKKMILKTLLDITITTSVQNRHVKAQMFQKQAGSVTTNQVY